MGNRSTLVYSEGCKVNKIKLGKIMSGWKGEDKEGYLDFVTNNLSLPDYIDDWKIQGYWYGHFVRFLQACAICMDGLDNVNDYGNYIEMEEEQGFRFTLKFFKGEDGINDVECEYVPMVTEMMYFDKKCARCKVMLKKDEVKVVGDKGYCHKDESVCMLNKI